MNGFRKHAWSLGLLLAGCDAVPDAATPPPRADVHVVPARFGELPIRVSVYGVAQSRGGAAQAISTQATGTVTQMDVTPGQAVRQGQPLLSLRLTPASWSAWHQAQRAVRTTKLSRDHLAALLAQQLATREQLNQADKALDDARDARDALAQQQGSAPTLLIRAPQDGIVLSIEVAPGQDVSAGTTVLSWLPTKALILRAGAEAASGIEPGDEATVSPLEQVEASTGSVTYVSAVLDPRTHQREVDITVAKPLLVGAGYRAEVVVRRQRGWLVPRQALIGDDDGGHVFQLDGSRAVAVPVSVRGEEGDLSVVDGPLDARRAVVDVGATQLDDGMAVHVVGGAAR